MLYFLVIWFGAIFSSTQTTVIFSDQDISKCLNNLFLVVEQTNRISLASFSDLQCHAEDQSDFMHFIVHTVLISCITVLYESYRTVMQLIG